MLLKFLKWIPEISQGCFLFVKYCLIVDFSGDIEAGVS